MVKSSWLKVVPNILSALAILYILAGYPTGLYAESRAAVISVDLKSVVQMEYRPEKNDFCSIFDMSHLSCNESWKIEFLPSNVAHVRHVLWKDFFWKIDIANRKAYRVSKGTFGQPGGEEKPIDNLAVQIIPQDGQPRPFFRLLAFQSVLEYDIAAKRARLIYEGDDIVSPDIWQVKDAGGGIYHLKYSPPQGFWLPSYWKIDCNKMKFARIAGGNFGSPGGSETPLWATVSVSNRAQARGNAPTVAVGPSVTKPVNVPAPGTGIVPVNKPINAQTGDPGVIPGNQSTFATNTSTGLMPINLPDRVSAWTEATKAQYHTLLKGESYDILVVPFQVQGNAIDRIGRSLMARYLVHRIKKTTDKKVPSLTLVSRALGDTARNLNDSEIYALANDLHVRMIIKGFIGHHQDMKMDMTIKVETPTHGAVFNESAKSVNISRENIPFTDEKLPSEAFLELLDGVMKEIPIQGTKAYRPADLYNKKTLPIPSNITGTAGSKPRTPVEEAFYLQLLASLYPEGTIGRESLLERSLVALQDVSSSSPDYKILKSRALAYLWRRPAALAALGKPETAAEKAMLANLNGDLPQMKSQAREIKEPVLKFIANIDVNNFSFSYNVPIDQKYFTAFMKEFPAWKTALTRLLNSRDPWSIQNNLEIKKELDKAFPIPDFTAEKLFQSVVVLGGNPFDSAEVQFSAYHHWQKLLARQPQKLRVIDDDIVAESDCLDLLVAIAESNLLREARLLIFNQGLPQEGIALLDHYDAVYQGHPEMAYLRSYALRTLAKMNKGMSGGNLEKTSEDLSLRACLWSNGQVYPADKTCSSLTFYDADFPRRPTWCIASSAPGDRLYGSGSGSVTTSAERQVYMLKNLEQSLAYTYGDFSLLVKYHAELLKAGQEKAAADLLENNKHRFIGRSSRTIFFGELKAKEGDYQGAIKLFKQAIAENPVAWNPYYQLGVLYVYIGQVNKAAETFKSFPWSGRGKKHVDNDDMHPVTLSNNAYAVGKYFLQRGMMEQSIPFFRRSLSYKTGSSAEMRSTYYLNMLEKKYLPAAKIALETGNRYGNDYNYYEYVKLLHVLGYHKEAWAAWDGRGLAYKSDVNWTPSIIGYRMAARKGDDQIAWLVSLDKNERRLALTCAGHYIFLSHLVDRAPNRDVAGLIDTIGDRFIQAKVPGYSRPGNVTPNTYLSYEARFADAYYKLRIKDYKTAFSMFKDLAGSIDEFFKYDSHKAMLPFLAQSGVKSGNGATAALYVDAYRKHIGEDYNYYLSAAYQNYASGNKKRALEMLDSARRTLPGDTRMNDTDGFPPLYQLFEACEWLYMDSKYDAFRTRALEWARIFQKVQPTTSWLYAIEAKFASSKDARLRPLALTLYLDPGSERISGIKKSEKTEAMKWLKHNNPFVIHKTGRTVQTFSM